jgi:dienelactone hydrolase
VRSPTPEVTEQAVRFGARDLFGILTEAHAWNAASAERKKPGLGVILLNAGAIHRIGMNRLYVSLARRWAASGARALRLDISGIGDSPADPSAGENRVYSPHAVSDVTAALDYLEGSRAGDRLAIIGLCSGAYAAFHAALADSRVASVTLINPQTFDFKPGDRLDVQRRRNFQEARHYQRAALRRESWAKALRGDVNFRYVSGVLYGRTKAVVSSLSSRIGEELGLKKREYPLYDAFRTLIERGCDVRLVYCKDDPGLLHLNEELGSLRRKLLSSPRFHLEVIDGADHTFTPLWSQAKLTEVLDECLAFEPRQGHRAKLPRDSEPRAAYLR